RISQKVIKDRLPPIAYNQENSRRLFVHVLNSTYFHLVTGLEAPPSPISVRTYNELKLPWYTLFDEELPDIHHSSEFSDVKSTECGYCTYEMATTQILPCAHNFCDDCAAKIAACPVCRTRITQRERFAAPMRMPGQEEEDSIEATSLQDRIVALKRCAEKGCVASFKLAEDAISGITG
ncbi:hypothetical protein GGX14DRAFT_318763, partial [Mycena pura]